jgi:hypothetical protein
MTRIHRRVAHKDRQAIPSGSLHLRFLWLYFPLINAEVEANPAPPDSKLLIIQIQYIWKHSVADLVNYCMVGYIQCTAVLVRCNVVCREGGWQYGGWTGSFYGFGSPLLVVCLVRICVLWNGQKSIA